nr:MAG TPA: hypothetical protein [Caudoviricetes sp.]
MSPSLNKKPIPLYRIKKHRITLKRKKKCKV